MQVKKKYYDRIFDFSGQWDMPSRCGLKIIGQKNPQVPPIVIVTELYQDNPGTSITAAGRSLAEQLCRQEGLDINKIRYFECSPGTDSKLSFYEEEIFEVDLRDTPVYRRLSAEEIRELHLFPNGGE